MTDATTESPATPKPKAHRRWPRRAAIAALAVIVCAGGFALYVSDYYRAAPTSELISGDSALSVAEDDTMIAIAPAADTATNAFEADNQSSGDGAGGASDQADDAGVAKAPGAAGERADSGDAGSSDESTESDETGTPSPSGSASPANPTGIVLYPGAKVDPHAYVPLAEKLAERGISCVIAKVPFNLAFFDIDAAARIMESIPDVQSWWVAGHSLGGVAAAQFASGHAETLEGIVFLASYPASDLSNTDLAALSIYGSNDTVLNRESLSENAAHMPKRRETLVIEGGNHAGFGAYGPQDGDSEAAVSADEQQEQAADAIAGFVQNARQTQAA